MAKVNAVIRRRCASLADDFGYDYAVRLFGADTIAALPKYTRGKRIGKTKGFIVWERAERGGWSQYGVLRPNQLARARLTAVYDGQMPLYGQWLGREQALERSVEAERHSPSTGY